MATAIPILDDFPVKPPDAPLHLRKELSIWRAPLVPVALAVTAGIVLDRQASVPWLVSLLFAIVALVAFLVTRPNQKSALPLVYLALAGVAVGAAYHHYYREVYAADDIGAFAIAEPRPVHVRGILAEEPIIHRRPRHNPLTSIPENETTTSVLEARSIRASDTWLTASGRAQLVVAGHLLGVHAGDEVDVVGRMSAPSRPANPGGPDHTQLLRDQRIRAIIAVQKTPEGVVRLSEGWPKSLSGLLGVIRGWGQRAVQQAIPEDQSPVATALLLGEGSTMSTEDWDKYVRTGVVHVLAVSGQHLTVLAIFLWLILRAAGARRRRGALIVAGLLLGYALMTGGRPPALRSAVMVCAACAAIYVRRPVSLANTFALSWLIVALLDPTDLAGVGCQLSFLAVAVLFWIAFHLYRPATGTTDRLLRWFRAPSDPLERLVEETRPAWQRTVWWLVRRVAFTYAITLLIWLSAAPLIASRLHIVSPVGILIGPPAVLLTSVALVAGFLLLLATAVGGPLVPALAWVMQTCLRWCDGLVAFAENLPGGYGYVGDLPEWWLWVYYLGAFVALIGPRINHHWCWVTLAFLAWISFGLLAWARPRPTDELRCTFLAVGHGGCTVIETPDGRVLLYDAGAMAGPDVTRRHIAPFLWSRGISRIDEVLLSHADLDHFNGVPALVERFAVGRVTTTPTFSEKATPGVEHALAFLRSRGIQVRTVRAGDQLTAGEVDLEVLHPPQHGPHGVENARSMVLLVRHAGFSMLLTGDLEGSGLERVLSLPPAPVDVLMAPHHGSRAANTPTLALWARPKLVISSQGPPRGSDGDLNPYKAIGADFLTTHRHGAVTIRSHATGMVVETFLTGQRSVIWSQDRKPTKERARLHGPSQFSVALLQVACYPRFRVRESDSQPAGASFDHSGVPP